MKRILSALSFIFVIIVYLLILWWTDKPKEPSAYRHAAEASLIEGQPKPEGHGK